MILIAVQWFQTPQREYSFTTFGPPPENVDYVWVFQPPLRDT